MYDLLLTNGILHGDPTATPLIRLHYLSILADERERERGRDSSDDLEEVSSHVIDCQWRGPGGRELWGAFTS